MNIDGLSLGLVERALAAEVEGAQVQKLVQLDKHSLLFKLHGREGNRDLVITVGHTPACYISSTVVDLPKEPSALCMFLRKHVEGSRITKVSQLFGDRILQLSLSRLALDSTIEITDIYIELMGKYSNCIFVKEGLILDALIHVSPLMNRERSIGPKQPYQLPPNAERMDLREMKDEEILPLLKTYKQDTVGATVRHIFNGFGTPVLKRVCELAEGSAPTFTMKTESQNMSAEQWESLAQSLCSLRDAITGGDVVYISGDGKHVSPIALGSDDEESHELAYLFPYMEAAVKADGSINTAQHSLRKLITAAIAKEEQRNKKIAAELADTANIDSYKERGDLLMIYSYLPRTYETDIVVDNVLIDPPSPITIPLKPELTLVENAQYFYKQYTKLKNRTINGAYQLEQSTARIEYLNSVLYGLDEAHSSHELEDIRLECMEAGLIKKSKKPVSFKIEGKNFLKFNLEDGATVLIGRNNRQNDQLTHRVARPRDLWFHSLGFQGSHLILQTETEASDEQIAKAAAYAAYFSKARESSKVPVDYTYVKNVKKPPASPLGYVTYTKQSTVYVDPIKPPDYTEN